MPRRASAARSSTQPLRAAARMGTISSPTRGICFPLPPAATNNQNAGAHALSLSHGDPLAAQGGIIFRLHQSSFQLRQEGPVDADRSSPPRLDELGDRHDALLSALRRGQGHAKATGRAKRTAKRMPRLTWRLMGSPALEMTGRLRASGTANPLNSGPANLKSMRSSLRCRSRPKIPGRLRGKLTGVQRSPFVESAQVAGGRARARRV